MPEAAMHPESRTGRSAAWHMPPSAESRRRKVLLLSPHWPPLSHPDLHRVRMSLPFLREFGWDPIVLRVRADEQDGVRDSTLIETVPSDVEIVETGHLPAWSTSWVGLRNPNLRAVAHLASLGSRLIRERGIDLVYLSTTVFPLFILGPWWRARTAIPFVLDFQDPWVSGYAGEAAPGRATWKYRLSQRFAASAEPYCLSRAAGVTSVSSGYIESFRRRYPWFDAGRGVTLPFGMAEGDLDALARSKQRNPCFDPADGLRHWVYLGRGGDDMRTAARALFLALARVRESNPERLRRLRIHMIGTSYSTRAPRPTFLPIAEEFGVADVVDEVPRRIPYLAALTCMRDAEALLILGSDDPQYVASKLMPCLLAQKPLLAVFHQRSDVVKLLREVHPRGLVTFCDNPDVGELAGRIGRAWLAGPLHDADHDCGSLAQYSAREMTGHLCELWDRALAGAGA